MPGWYRMMALLAGAFIGIAQDEPEQAARDAHDALTVAAGTQGYLRVDDTLECLARLAVNDDNHAYAARLLGAAESIGRRMGHPRLPDVSSRL
ncbi:hypothetical protein [Mycobacterium ostraviense]|uniref:hypothetical protein n=1 Tax=Mycobacterium ostraviense TaxID=2738409 RepID=UPI0011568B43|nr:hypothetical protein [Mycobacterium ostraviense]UGT93151.1 hypothetical protein LTS72_07540 [Mycobacterium ostraviense]